MFKDSRPSKRPRLSWSRNNEIQIDQAAEQANPNVLNPSQIVLTETTSPETTISGSSPLHLTRENTAQESFGSISGGDAFLSPSTTSVPDEFAANPKFLQLQEELRSLLVTRAQSNAPTRATSPDDRHEGDDVETGRMHVTRQILCNSNRHKYFKNYMNEVAPWLDMFDMKRHFGVELPHMAHGSATLLYAMLALSARHVERKNRLGKWSESLELYQHAIRLLTPSLEARDPNILATCVILCCLEMMSASPWNWGRHLEGCAALFQSYGVNGFSGGLLQAVFWCYTRMDLCAALISDGMESTVLPLEYWIPPGVSPQEVASMVAQTQVPDMHANYAVYLAAKVCSLLAQRTKATEFGIDNGCIGENFVNQWCQLWDEIQKWRENRPSELIPVKVVNPTKETLFPSILFAHWAAISSNQLHHTACVLLLNIAPTSVSTGPTPFNSSMWHARRIVGISMTNLHEGCLNNSLQPLWIAGKLLSHRLEHIAVVKLIRSIEYRTGWGFCWRIKDLEEAWGYERGELDEQR